MRLIKRLWCIFAFLVCSTSVFAYHDEEIIDISGFNYGRLQIAVNVEKNPRTNKKQLMKTVGLLKRNLMWSGLFDIKNLYDNVDLILKLRFIPNHEIRAWIFTPDNTTLFDHRLKISGPDDIEPQTVRMIEEIIFQLTGERSVLRSAIAYVEKDAIGIYRIMLTDAFGDKSYELLNDGNYNILPRWKPDGSSIIFTTLGRKGSHLRMLSFASGEIFTLFKNLSKTSGGSWAGSGKELVITKSKQGNSDLFKIDLKGNIIQQMTKRSTTETNPRLSPDGGRLLFVSNRSGSIQIYQRILDTGDTFRMTYEGPMNYEPNWSNDGAYIVFSGLKDNFRQIFLMDRDGDFVQQVTSGNSSSEQPVWSPSGRQILYVSKSNFEQKLYIIRADGTYKRRLTKTGPGISEFNPTWSARYRWKPFKIKSNQ